MMTKNRLSLVSRLQSFLRAEDGNAVVDWVVLAVGVVGLGIVVGATVGSGAVAHGDKTTMALETIADDL